jgi:hypothetical protein
LEHLPFQEYFWRTGKGEDIANLWQISKFTKPREHNRTIIESVEKSGTSAFPGVDSETRQEEDLRTSSKDLSPCRPENTKEPSQH